MQFKGSSLVTSCIVLFWLTGHGQNIRKHLELTADVPHFHGNTGSVRPVLAITVSTYLWLLVCTCLSDSSRILDVQKTRLLSSHVVNPIEAYLLLLWIWHL